MGIKVLYIAGSNRCGSTLLSHILGEIPGVMNSGESIGYLLNKRMRFPFVRCACGSPPNDCPIWSKVISQVDQEVLDLCTSLSWPKFMLTYSKKEREKISAKITRQIESIYRLISQLTGKTLIVDASKRPFLAYFVSQSSEVEFYVLHLIRDARAVVASSLKPKDYLEESTLWQSLGGWLRSNLLTSILFREYPHYRKLFYEDMVQSPSNLLDSILDWWGLDRTLNPITNSSIKFTEQQHGIAGNPEKKYFAPGSVVEIKYRDWHLNSLERQIVNICAYPFYKWWKNHGY